MLPPPLAIAQEGASAPPANRDERKDDIGLELTIWDGQINIVPEKTREDGKVTKYKDEWDVPPVADNLEDVKRGAVSVANKNNTNGDWEKKATQKTLEETPGILDNAQNSVKKTKRGRDEVDLMKLLLQIDQLKVEKEDEDDPVYLYVLNKTPNAEIWKESFKGPKNGKNKLTIEKDGKKFAKFTVKELMADFSKKKLKDQGGKVVWLEVQDVSKSCRDVVLQLKYVKQSDKKLWGWDVVMATAVWVVKGDTNGNPWCKRGNKNPKPPPIYTDGFPDNPVPGPGKDLPDLTKKSVIDAVNTHRISSDGSRYGHETMGPIHQLKVDLKFGGRILWEFEILPSDLSKPSPTNPKITNLKALDLVFDITRQVKYLDQIKLKGKKPQPDEKEDFPWVKTGDNELPNDDLGTKDEQNVPENLHLYSFDSPCSWRYASGIDKVTSRNTFKEWVRISLRGEEFPKDAETREEKGQNQVVGSRASKKYDWHCFLGLIAPPPPSKPLPLVKNANETNATKVGYRDVTKK